MYIYIYIYIYILINIINLYNIPNFVCRAYIYIYIYIYIYNLIRIYILYKVVGELIKLAHPYLHVTGHLSKPHIRLAESFCLGHCRALGLVIN